MGGRSRFVSKSLRKCKELSKLEQREAHSYNKVAAHTRRMANGWPVNMKTFERDREDLSYAKEQTRLHKENCETCIKNTELLESKKNTQDTVNN